METYERITALAKKKNMDRKTLIRKLLELEPVSTRTGKVPTEKTVYSWLAGRTPIEPEMLTLFAQILGTTELEFFRDSEEKKEQIVKEAIKNPSTSVKSYLIEAGYGTDRVKEVDLYDGYVGGGSAGEIEDGVNSFYIDKYVIDKPYREKKIHAIRIIGDSMVPYISEGDIALYIDVEDGEQLSDGKYIIDTVHGKMLKNLKFHLDGSVTISSENEKYRPERVPKSSQESFAIVGRVVGRILKS